MLDVRRILLLVEVAERGSLTAAAEAESMTVSAASQQMTRLESEVGQPLLERLPRGVRLTDAGSALAARGRAIRRELRGAAADLEAFSGVRAGALRLGSFPTASASLLPHALTRFARRFPKVATTVRSALRAELLDLLHSGEVELALLWDYEWDRIDERALSVTHVLDDPTVLVVPVNSDLFGVEALELSALAGQRWITRADNHPVAEVLRRHCRRAGFDPIIAYEAQDYQEAQAMVAAGIGIAIAPRLAMVNRRDDVGVVGFASGVPAPTRRILLARTEHRAPTPAVAAMHRVLEQVGARFAEPGRVRGRLDSVRPRARR